MIAGLMHIRDIFNRDTQTFSFEFFPPKPGEAWEKLFDRISDFEALAPSFVSVTYGAGGSTRERTHDLVVKLRASTELDPVPHLTCVMQSENDMRSILSRYAEAGVSNIMALHGDPPADATDYSREDETYRYAADLVRFIREFNDSGEHPDDRGFGIGVAGFPEGHPATPNFLEGMEHLKAKVDAGADYICTQMFFDNAVFYDFCERCELAGIDVPILAGIMPIASRRNLERMAELAAGTRFPAPLLRAVDRCGDDSEAVSRVGVHWATEQCRDLVDNRVDGIHFYTLNRSQATCDIYRTLGVPDSRALRTP